MFTHLTFLHAGRVRNAPCCWVAALMTCFLLRAATLVCRKPGYCMRTSTASFTPTMRITGVLAGVFLAWAHIYVQIHFSKLLCIPCEMKYFWLSSILPLYLLAVFFRLPACSGDSVSVADLLLAHSHSLSATSAF